MTVHHPLTRSRVAAGTWALDPDHTTLGFAVRHAGVANVRGRFTDYDGTITVDADGRMTGEAVVRVASVTTSLAQRDDHLRSEDFFDAERYPELRFRAHDVLADGEDLTVVGELTIRDVTRPVTLRGELYGTGVDDEGLTRLGLSLSGRLSRAEFGMRFNFALGGGNVLVADAVRLDLELSAVLRD